MMEAGCRAAEDRKGEQPDEHVKVKGQSWSALENKPVGMTSFQPTSFTCFSFIFPSEAIVAMLGFVFG